MEKADRKVLFMMPKEDRKGPQKKKVEWLGRVRLRKKKKKKKKKRR